MNYSDKLPKIAVASGCQPRNPSPAPSFGFCQPRAMASGKQLKVAVVGSTGYAGSHACIELLSRGHLVSGVSRNPDKIGTHPHYTSIPIDLETASIAEIVDAFTGHDVVVKYLFIVVSFINLQHLRPT